MAYQGAVFDFNGTLFWDTRLHNAAWDALFERYGIRIADEEKHRCFHGRVNADILKSVFPNGLSDTDIAALSAEKESFYRESCRRSGLGLAPGAAEFLAFLARTGIPYTIATSSGKENVDFFFETLGLGAWFDRGKIVFDDGRIKAKPDPEFYLKAIGLIALEPRRVVVFEDSVQGILAAENAEAGKIIIVDSEGGDYENLPYTRIRDFGEVDRALFQGNRKRAS